MILWVIIIAACVILDQLTKWIVVNSMELYESIVLIPKVFSFTYIPNYGAAWGIFSEQRWVFMLVTSVALIIMPIILYRYRKVHFLFNLSLSLFIGGAIGNMIDRVFVGYVVDFLEFTFINYPVFNVADIFVVFGAGIMIVYALFFDKTFFVDKKKAPVSVNTEEDTANDGADQKDLDNGN